MKYFLPLALACCVLAILPVPLLGELARLALIGCIGIALCTAFAPRTTHVERIVIGIACATSALLLLSFVFAPNSIFSRLVFSALAAAFFIVSRKTVPALTSGKYAWHVGLLCAAPAVLIFILNPYIHFLSDGWWHFSIHGLLQHSGLPLANPWLATQPVAYPFAMHVLLVYIFGASTLPVHLFYACATVIVTILLGALVYKLIRDETSDRVGIWGAVCFLFLSSIGGLVFAWDVIRFAFTHGTGFVQQYLAFLQLHQGPHMWYTAMKFIASSGINTVFQSTIMLAFFPLLLFTAVMYFLLRRQHLLSALMFLPLFAANPVFAIIAGACIAVTWVYDFKLKGVLYAALVAVSSAFVCAPYLRQLFTKTLVGSGSFVSFLPAKGLSSLLLFCIGYLPFLALAIRSTYKREYSKRTHILLVGFAGVNLLAMLLLSLGYLYATTTAFIILAILSAPYLASVRLSWKPAQLLRIGIILVTLASTLLLIATYCYYTVRLDERDIQASKWLAENTPTDSVVLVYSGDLTDRYLHLYPTVFGKRSAYIADIYGLEAYGEDFSKERATYNEIFLYKDKTTLCGLAVQYVYIPAHAFNNTPSTQWIADAPCARVVYSENAVIYALH
jgi:hypothetical protein